MELEFTADQDELRDSIRAVLARESPVALARRVVDDDERPDALWATLTELGWPALTIAEADGGIGLGMIEAGILAEEIGRVIAPGPLLATVSQFVPAVREAGTAEQRARFLGAVAAGACSGTLAVAETRGSFDPAAVTATVVVRRRRRGAGGREALRRRGRRGRRARRRRPRTGNRRATTASTRSSFRSRRPAPAASNALDGSRRFAHVDLDGVRVERDRVLGDGTSSSAAALRRAIEEATVATALEIVGAAQTIFDVTLDYAKHREQFGVPIGSFQAIKHKFADMIVALERARATGYFAALTIAEDDPRRTTATSVAKVAAGDCQRLLAKEGIQIHGGIGYTWEHDMHLYVKRAKSLEPLFGSSSTHRAHIADLLGV